MAVNTCSICIKKPQSKLVQLSSIKVTDHKPLVILGPKNLIPSLAAVRLEKWAVPLSEYQYDIEFRPTKEDCNADGLSRLPRHETVTIGTDGAGFNVSQMESLPISMGQLRQSTHKDPMLSKVCHLTEVGWLKQYPVLLKLFAN